MKATTKTAQFTPGPYELRGPRLLTDSNGVVLADNIGANWPGTIDGQANLFTAAPAMYEALRALVDVFPSVVRTTPYGVSMDISKRCFLQRLHDNAKAALQQAEGR